MAIKKLSDETLRQHKGISFTGISTAFICHDGNGKILLSKRSKNARDENGRWDSGAGGLKHGQTVQDNIRRELKEEYGVEPIKMDFLGYLDMFRKTPSGQATHWLGISYAVQVDPAKVIIGEPDMVDEIGWFSLDKLPEPMHSQFDNFLAKHGAKLKESMAFTQNA